MESLSGGQSSTATTRNLGEGGVLFDTELPLAPNERVSLCGLSGVTKVAKCVEGIGLRSAKRAERNTAGCYEVAVEFC